MLPFAAFAAVAACLLALLPARAAADEHGFPQGPFA